jgi:hypothetical protein
MLEFLDASFRHKARAARRRFVNPTMTAPVIANLRAQQCNFPEPITSTLFAYGAVN